jgi:hypothetical protein
MSRRKTTTHTSAFHDSERELLKSASTPTAGRHRATADKPALTPARVSEPAPAKRVRTQRPLQPKM